MKANSHWRNFFFKKITIAKWQFNLFGLACFSVGAVWGVYLMASGTFPKIFAMTGSSIEKTANGDFSVGIFSNTARVTGAGVDGSVGLRKSFSGVENANYQSDITNTPGLVSYWKMDGDLTDSKGVNNGTLADRYVSPSFAASKYGSNSASFDGANGYLNLGTDSSLDIEHAPFSIETWFKLNDTSADQNIYTSTMIDGSGSFLTINRWGGNNVTLSKAGLVDQMVDYVFEADRWYHLVAVNNFSGEYPTDVVFYVDGQAIGSYADNRSYIDSSNRAHAFAGITFSGMHPINGLVDEFALYNNALSAGTVAEHFGSLDYQTTVENTPGLVSYWKMDGNFNDSKGNNTANKVFGGSKYGTGSVELNGVSNYVLVPGKPSLNPTTQLSLEAWVNFYGDGVGNSPIISKKNDQNLQYLLARLGNGDHRVIFALYLNDSWQDLVISNTVLNDNQWYDVAATFDGTTAKIYINGVLNASTEQAGVLTGTDNGDVWIGGDDWNHVGDPTGWTEFASALIDEVSVYNTALDAQTILDHYSAIYDTTGTWESPADDRGLDLIWNGGWGDGSDGSTAFSAEVANLGGAKNGKMTFYLRTAPSVNELQTASYIDIGVATGGTTFTKTKKELDDLGVGTGANRYMQVKVLLEQDVDSNISPELQAFTVNYLADNTAPESSAAGIVLKKNASGAVVLSNYWTNDSAPYFSWTAGADFQAGIKGYCLYLGHDIAGNPGSTGGGGTKGDFLGTSPVSTVGTGCDFIVDAPYVDFANTAFRAQSWLSSSNDPYYLNVKAIDKNNNVYEGASTQFQFRFDNTAPANPLYVSLPGDFISSKSTSLTWPTQGNDAAADANSGVLGLQYKVGPTGTWYGALHSATQDMNDVLADDGEYTFQENPDFVDIKDGFNPIYMRTVDVAGNIAVSAITGNLKINTIAPSAVKNLQVNPADSTSNSYAFSWEKPDSFIAPASKLKYCYTVNTLPSVNSCAYTSEGATTLPADSFATRPGANTFYVSTKDVSGNINYDVYTSVDFTYSGSAPGISRSIDVADISIKATANWKLAVSWEAPENLGAGIDSYEIFRSQNEAVCAITPNAFEKIGSTAGTSYVDTGLSQKDYYYCVKACDSANSCSAFSATVTRYPNGKFTEPAELSSGADVSKITTKRANISWATARKADSKVAYGKKSEDYYTEEPSTSEQVTDHSINLEGLSPGTTYYYRAKWTDEDGNVGSAEEKSFKTEPAPTVSAVKAGDIGLSSASIGFTTKNANKAKIYYGPSTSFGAAKEIPTAKSEAEYSYMLTGLTDNSKYYYKINTFDSENNEYEGTILDFTTLPRPRISDVQVEQVKDSAQPGVHIVWSSNTEISSIVSFNPVSEPTDKRDDVQVELVAGQHEATIMDLKPMLTYSLIVRGIDRAGNEAVSDPYSFTTASDTRPPAISNVMVEGINVGTGADKRSQLAVSWDTDEPATSQVEFGEGVSANYAQKTQQDFNLTMNHMVVISGLEPSKVYHLQAVSNDSVNNTARSVDTVSITPKAMDSAYELVVGNLLDVFKFLRGIQN